MPGRLIEIQTCNSQDTPLLHSCNNTNILTNIFVSNTNNIPCIKFVLTNLLYSVYSNQCMLKDGSLIEELEDILGGLEQRIMMYRTRLIELQKKRDRLDDEIKTGKRYLELAETLYKVERNKSRTSQQAQPEDSDKSSSKQSEETQDLLSNQFKYSGLSITQATYLLLKEEGRALHAKEIYMRLLEGGVKIRSKTPITSVSISLNRDKRFQRVSPNTYSLSGEETQGHERR